MKKIKLVLFVLGLTCAQTTQCSMETAALVAAGIGCGAAGVYLEKHLIRKKIQFTIIQNARKEYENKREIVENSERNRNQIEIFGVLHHATALRAERDQRDAERAFLQNPQAINNATDRNLSINFHISQKCSAFLHYSAIGFGVIYLLKNERTIFNILFNTVSLAILARPLIFGNRKATKTENNIKLEFPSDNFMNHIAYCGGIHGLKFLIAKGLGLQL